MLWSTMRTFLNDEDDGKKEGEEVGGGGTG